MVMEKIMAERVWRSKVAQLRTAGMQTERERERDQGPKIPFKDTSPVIYFHQPGLTS
jgi:hypothetical protein